MRLLSWLDGLTPVPWRRLTKRGQPRSEPADCKLSIEALEDRCQPSFLAPVSYAISPTPPALTTAAMLTADFNGDGRLDLAVANSLVGSSYSVAVLLGNADGTFQPALTSATSYHPAFSLAAGDFNADGKLDVATGNTGHSYERSSVSVLLGNGNGTFQSPISIALGLDGASVAVGDFNGDGKLDLGVTSNRAYQGYYGDIGFVGAASVLLGNGDGTFGTPSTTMLGGGYHFSAAVADFNGDGNQDFATANSEYPTVSLLLGTGTGNLGAPTYFSAGDQPFSVAAGDVNGDGKLDLVTANLYASNISVLLGTGTGSFETAENYAAGGGLSVVFGDFDHDTNLDIADGSVVLRGTGNGTFLAPLSFAGGFSVGAGDFNGDGWLDAATANAASGQTISVLINDQSWPPTGAPSVSISDVTVTEGNTGTVNATFTVNLSATYGQPVTVHYATADGTATAGSDYSAASGDVTFAPSETSKTISVVVLGDRLGEPNETFVVNLGTADAFIGDGQGAATIVDDEPRISINDKTVTEGNTSSLGATFTVTLSAAYDQDVTVHFATVNGSATAGSDYAAASGNVTIAAGQTSQTFTVSVTGDRLGEPNESFVVNLSAATNGLIVDNQSIVTILDNEPRVSIGDVTKQEGKKGQTTLFTFTVTLSAAYDQAVTMSYATANGTAKTNDNDYIARTGTLTFAPGETTKTITIEVKGDSKREANETFYLDLFGNSGNSWFSKSRGTGTIQNDD